MGFTCGLVGLPNAGKSTLFTALTGADTLIAPYPFSTLEPRKGVVPVPDDRLDGLTAALKPAKVTPAHLEVMDIAGLVEGASRGEGLGNQFLSHIRAVDALAHVVRCFRAGDVPHVGGEPDPRRDTGIVNTELLLADLEVVERRLDKVRRVAKADPKAARAELAFLERCRDALGRGMPLRALELDAHDLAIARELGLLTAKSLCYVANVDRGDPTSLALAEHLAAVAGHAPVVTVDGKLEGEIAQLSAEEQRQFLAEWGLAESALVRLIKVGYRLLGLITFYTVVGEELRAWSLKDGATAVEAAGQIHTDMARGFVRAEVTRVEDFLATPVWAALRERGLVRLEGRDYRVRDGDILTIRFTV
ncbi:MAG: redox-regulated ATPase YchF [Candidatus Rokubacteria bacterium RIFCSPLOWO2_02_FULL_68_19]|nr:MAG: redox-regulated ATPase YchF [Candidatus Rokubacteria bacterium RIFCSPLOWO2_02_FULL_68_19]